MKLENHPAAEIFPLMEGEAFNAFVADIKEHGLRDPIVLHDGRILDGRNRYRACQQLGIEVRTDEWDPVGTPEAFVISHNLHRRHLTTSQRAMIAARLSTRAIGGNQKKSNAQNWALNTRKQSGALLNVSKGSIDNAKAVLNKGTEEEIRAVEAGVLAVDTAARAIRSGLPPDERARQRAAPKKRKPPTYKGTKKLSEPERIEQVRSLSEQGYNADQIGQKIGVKPDYVGILARRGGIALSYITVGKTKRLNANRIVEETINALSGIALGLTVLNIFELDHTKIADWMASLDESMPAINRLRRQLKGLTNGNESEAA